MSTKQTLDASGTYDLAPFGSGTPIVQLDGTSDWSGMLVLKVNTAAPGQPASYQTVPVRPRGTTVNLPAGTSLHYEGQFEPITGGLPLVGVYLHTAGSVVVTVLPNAVPTPDATTIPLGNVTLTAIPASYPEDLAFQFQLAADNAGTP